MRDVRAHQAQRQMPPHAPSWCGVMWALDCGPKVGVGGGGGEGKILLTQGIESPYGIL